MGKLLDLIKQEVKASEQVKMHAIKPSSCVTNRGSNYIITLVSII